MRGDWYMDIVFKEFKPSEKLKPYIEFFWTGKFNINAHGLFSQRVIPNGYVELIIHLSDFHCELLQGLDFSPSPDYTIIGLFTAPYDVHFRNTVDVFGIRFKPEGIFHLFNLPAVEIQSDFADMESFTRAQFREFTSQIKEMKTNEEMIALTEKYFMKNLDHSKLNLYYLNHAAEMIRMTKGMISIEQLSSRVFISRRQLEREFKQKLGLSPKSYMRIARLNEVNRQIQNGKRFQLTEIAYNCGYVDQAHFIKDFKYFTGETPNLFVKEQDKFIINPNMAEMSGIDKIEL
jgi:AraC-like DNA-binding protein